MTKQFTSEDIHAGLHPTIFADREDLINEPLGWQKLGLQQTATGYGSKLTSPYKIAFNGKVYRLYATCFSNVASHWFKSKGRKIFVN